MNILKNESSFQVSQIKSHWQWGRGIRAAVSIFLPFMYGLLFKDIMTGMWVGMGCLMMITGEISGTYKDIYRGMFISAIIGSLGYLMGYLGSLPWGIVIGVMVCTGVISQYLSGINHTLSIGMLQFLLLASIALGVPSIENFWIPSILYLVGTLLYALLLSIEVLWSKLKPFSLHNVSMSKKDKINQDLKFDSSLKSAQIIVLGLCLGIAYSLHIIDDNPHWFWIPLTVGLIMKPDLGAINTRMFQRTIGTLIGVIIGALLLIFVPKNIYFVISMAILAGLLPWAMSCSYTLQAIFLTPLILLLVNIISPGNTDIDYAIQRFLDTFIGGVIVIIFGYIPLYYYRSIISNNNM